MKNLFKIIMAISMVLIIFIAANSIFSFAGNPLKFYSYKSHVLTYLKKKYPETKFNITDSSYNFKDRSYIIEVEPLSSSNDRFNVNISNEGIIKDYYVETKFQNEIKTQIYYALKKQYKNLDVSVDVFLPKGYKYKSSDKYSTDINGYKVMLNIKWEKKNMNKKIFIDNCIKINGKMKNMGICPDSCIYSCDDDIGNYSITIYKDNEYGANINMTSDEIQNGNFVTYYRH